MLFINKNQINSIAHSLFLHMKDDKKPKLTDIKNIILSSLGENNLYSFQKKESLHRTHLLSFFKIEEIANLLFLHQETSTFPVFEASTYILRKRELTDLLENNKDKTLAELHDQIRPLIQYGHILDLFIEAESYNFTVFNSAWYDKDVQSKTNYSLRKKLLNQIKFLNYAPCYTEYFITYFENKNFFNNSVKISFLDFIKFNMRSINKEDTLFFIRFINDIAYNLSSFIKISSLLEANTSDNKLKNYALREKDLNNISQSIKKKKIKSPDDIFLIIKNNFEYKIDIFSLKARDTIPWIIIYYFDAIFEKQYDKIKAVNNYIEFFNKHGYMDFFDYATQFALFIFENENSLEKSEEMYRIISMLEKYKDKNIVLLDKKWLQHNNLETIKINNPRNNNYDWDNIFKKEITQNINFTISWLYDDAFIEYAFNKISEENPQIYLFDLFFDQVMMIDHEKKVTIQDLFKNILKNNYTEEVATSFTDSVKRKSNLKKI